MNGFAILVLTLMISTIGAAFADSICNNAPCEEQMNVTLPGEFNITLDSNPTTGFSWWTQFDPQYLDLVNETFAANNSRPGMTGVGGQDVFTFEARKAGDTHVTMLLLRPWVNGTIAESKIIPVNITA
jgi:inhibitor of cysteine peptidase